MNQNKIIVEGLTKIQQLELRSELENLVSQSPAADRGVPGAIAFEPGTAELIIYATNAALAVLAMYLGRATSHKVLKLKAVHGKQTLELKYKSDEADPSKASELISSLGSFFGLEK